MSWSSRGLFPLSHMVVLESRFKPRPVWTHIYACLLCLAGQPVGGTLCARAWRWELRAAV